MSVRFDNDLLGSHSSGPQAPVLWAFIRLLEFDVSIPVEFLVDTGATRTTVHERDWTGLFPDADVRTGRIESMIGIGGEPDYAWHKCLVGLTNANGDAYWIDDIIEVGFGLDAQTFGLPGLFGRDIINLGTMSLNGPASSFHLDLPAIPLGQLTRPEQP